MQDKAEFLLPAPGRTPWNKGKLIGAKPPLRQKHVWAIRTKLQIDQRIRDLALFNLAIDSKLRGCDVVALKVEHACSCAPAWHGAARWFRRAMNNYRPTFYVCAAIVRARRRRIGDRRKKRPPLIAVF